MLAIAILAAGKGTRMKSSLPKVLHNLGGTSLIERVLETAYAIKPDRIFIIIGHQGVMVKERLKKFTDIEFIEQIPQNGTGHAVQKLIPVLNDFSGDLLVLNGDVPLLRKETVKTLIKKHRESQSGVTLLTATLKNPKGYGRIFTDEKNHIRTIIEDKDCNISQRSQTLINAGIYCFNWHQLKIFLPKY